MGGPLHGSLILGLEEAAILLVLLQSMHYSLRVKVLVGNHEAMYVDMVVLNSSRQNIANTLLYQEVLAQSGY